MKVPPALWKITKEVARHLLRRPVVGIATAARVPDGRWLLIRRGDSGDWALPGGTLEWGETLRDAITREVLEETGAEVQELGDVIGVYSRPDRDPRFHAVTVLVHSKIDLPKQVPVNPLEVTEVRLFAESELPSELSHGMTEMLHDARSGKRTWE